MCDVIRGDSFRVCFCSNDLFSEMKFLVINYLPTPVTLTPPPFPSEA